MLELLVLILVLGSVGTKMNHASASSKMSMTSSRSGVRCGARGTAILSNLHTDGVVVVLVPGTEGGSCWRRRGKVGLIWGSGPGSAGLILPRNAQDRNVQDGGHEKIEAACERAGGRPAWGSEGDRPGQIHVRTTTSRFRQSVLVLDPQARTQARWRSSRLAVWSL